MPPPAASARTSGTAATDCGDREILGLGLLQRTVLAARRAGYGRIFLLEPGGIAPPGIVSIGGWDRLAAALAPHETASLLIVPTTILAETAWLERLASARIEPHAWVAIPDRIVMLSAAAMPEALHALGAEGGAGDLTSAQARLVRRFGPPGPLPGGSDPMIVAGPADIPAAEQRLLRTLVKDTDGFMARHLERPISLSISRRLASTVVTPNQMTLISAAVGLAGAPFFLSAQALWQTTGALLFLAHSTLDGCDGELARLKFQESRSGGVLDFWGDNVVHAVIFACMAIGWSWAIGEAWPLLLGLAAVSGTLASAGFVYWRMMRGEDDAGRAYTSVATLPNRRLARLLDALSRRDFIYSAIVLALFGKASWFLLLAAMGAPIYLLLLVLLAINEHAVNTSTPAAT